MLALNDTGFVPADIVAEDADVVLGKSTVLVFEQIAGAVAGLALLYRNQPDLLFTVSFGLDQPFKVAEVVPTLVTIALEAVGKFLISV